jgi:hypothetical protein
MADFLGKYPICMACFIHKATSFEFAFRHFRLAVVALAIANEK